MDSSSVDLLDGSQPAGPIPSQQRSGRGLFFRSPEEPETDPDNGLPMGPPPTGEDGDEGSVSGLEPSPDEWADPSGDPTSSTGSSGADRPAQLLSKAAMRQTAETAVKVSTGMAHTVAAKTEAQRSVGLYLADDDDARAIGHPLADMMHRRGDIVGGKLSPDANDFLRSLMGVAGYFAKQVQRIGVVRQLEAGQGAADPQTIPGAA
jgi:hypothetical protein